MHMTKTPVLNPLRQYKLKDFVRCRDQKEWICDHCFRCGDPAHCSDNVTMYKLPDEDFSLCSICLKGVQ